MNFIENETEQKLRGGYYTPLDLAAYIARWATEEGPRAILEPSCGDGIFIEALAVARPASRQRFVGFEIFEEEARKGEKRSRCFPLIQCKIHHGDFLDFAIKSILGSQKEFYCVVGNPPFVRYQYLPEDAQRKAEAIFKLLRLPFTKHTNAWVPFVLASVEMLTPGGRLGMIVPAEIIHVMHAQSLRNFLGATCKRLLIIDPEQIWFDGTLQGAVILLAEKKVNPDQHSDGVGIVRVSGRSFTAGDPSKLFNDAAQINGRTVEGKWTRAMLTSSERELFDRTCEHKCVVRFEEAASVDVGIVTGANGFFLVPDEMVAKFGLHGYAHPMFGRSEHCPGIIYDGRQHAENARVGNPTNFLWITEPKSALPVRVLQYIESGERNRLHTRYKCRTREPWYRVPSVYSTGVAMLKRCHDTPRLILNKLRAYTTDTAYRVIPRKVSPEKLVCCFLNPVTALSAELEGRHYGGGVLELVPSEIEKLAVPLPEAVRPQLRELDVKVRSESACSVLEQQGELILGAIGAGSKSREELLAAWLRLKNRRQRIAEEDDD
jgi:adenine-specific DNA methylase